MSPDPDSYSVKKFLHMQIILQVYKNEKTEGVSENNSHYERIEWKIQMGDTVVGLNGHDNSKGGKLAKIWGMS